MNDQFHDQKDILLSLKHEISLLHQQVDYLIRNEKSLGLLDLDVLMNRTHTIYDKLCSINIGNPPANDEDVEFNPEMLNALFGMDDGDDEDEYFDDEEEQPAAVTVEETTETPQSLFDVTGDEPTEKTPEEEPAEVKEEEPVEQPAEPLEEEPAEVQGEEPVEPLEEEPAETPIEEPLETPAEELPEMTAPEQEEQAQEEKPEEQDFGFIFKMEPLEEPTEEPIEEPQEEPIEEPAEEPAREPDLFTEGNKRNFYTTGDEIEMTIPHFDFPAENEDEEEHLPEEPEVDQHEEHPVVEPLEEDDEPEPEVDLFPEENDDFDEENFPEDQPKGQLPKENDEPEPEADLFPEENDDFDEEPLEQLPEDNDEPGPDFFAEEPTEEPAMDNDIAYEPIIFGDMDEKEDMGFELESPETLGDKMQQEDHSLAHRLQNQSVNDLRSSIGINDKFLFVNELFGGSMEKYNRSIGNLDDLKTLNGALIYLNEMRIELQWNSNNEAYKKLLTLVHSKFE